MAFTIDSSGLQSTPLGNAWIESGSPRASLTAMLDGKPVSAQFSDSSNGTLLSGGLPDPSQIAGAGLAWEFEANGFGKTTITAIYKAPTGNLIASMDLYVGSVLIAGSDGMYWQVYPDGSSHVLHEKDLIGDVQTLVKNNTVVADLTANSTATAVTCYLLNLKSFMPKPQ